MDLPLAGSLSANVFKYATGFSAVTFDAPGAAKSFPNACIHQQVSHTAGNLPHSAPIFAR
jgi:hypothetical protein